MKAGAVEGVWQEFHSRLFNFVLNQVNSPADAEDIVQEVFLKIHRGIDTLKEEGNLMAWVYQITRHAIIDFYRSPTRRAETSIDKVTEAFLERKVEEESNLADRSENSQKAFQEIANCLLPMIERLPPLYREAVRQVEIGGVTQVGLAHNLELPVPTIKSRVQRGRKKLKQMLVDCCYFEFSRDNKLIDYRSKNETCSSCGN